MGIGDSPIENLNYLLNVAEQIFAPDEGPDLDLHDTKIANVPVRVYKPKHLDAKSTGVVYIHGGGWTIGSVGKFPLIIICSGVTLWFLNPLPLVLPLFPPPPLPNHVKAILRDLVVMKS